MIVNAWLIIDSKGDRPYLCTHEPKNLELRPGVRVLRYELVVPDALNAEVGGRVLAAEVGGVNHE